MSKRPTAEEIRRATANISVVGDAWKNIASATEADLRRKGMTLDMGVEPEIRNLQTFGDVPQDIAPVPLAKAEQSQRQSSISRQASNDPIDYAIDVCMEAMEAAKEVIRARTGNRVDIKSIIRDAWENDMDEFLNDIER